MKIQDLFSELPTPSSHSTTQPISTNRHQEVAPSTNDNPVYQPSPLLQFAYSHNITELNYTEDQTSIGYRKDNSMALYAHSSTNFQMRQETISIEATFSAESLGLTAKDFEQSGNQPLQFSLSLKKSDIQIAYKSHTQTVQPMRPADEILRDLGKSIVDAMRNKGGGILLNLDEEALSTLLSDEKISKVFKELLNLIAMVNSMKKLEGKRGKNEINISGKGQHYIDHAESLSINNQETSIEFKFTILPPSTEQKQPQISAQTANTSEPAEQPALDIKV